MLMRQLVISAMLVCGAMGLASCSGPAHGVVVTNSTDRIVKAQLLQLRKDGEMTVYSSQIVGVGGEFRNLVDPDDYRRGMRVRFLLADQTVDDGNSVMLNLPSDKDRLYDLVLVGPRLSARELVGGKRPKTID
jgi:hypothetical protein